MKWTLINEIYPNRYPALKYHATTFYAANPNSLPEILAFCFSFRKCRSSIDTCVICEMCDCFAQLGISLFIFSVLVHMVVEKICCKRLSCSSGLIKHLCQCDWLAYLWKSPCATGCSPPSCRLAFCKPMCVCLDINQPSALTLRSTSAALQIFVACVRSCVWPLFICWFLQLSTCLTALIKTDKEAEVRRAAVHVIALVLRGLSDKTTQVSVFVIS